MSINDLDHYLINHQSLVTFRNTESITINAGEAKLVVIYPEVDLPVDSTTLFGVIFASPNGIPQIIAYPSSVVVTDNKIGLRISLYNTYSSSFTLTPGQLYVWVSTGVDG